MLTKNNTNNNYKNRVNYNNVKNFNLDGDNGNPANNKTKVKVKLEGNLANIKKRVELEKELSSYDAIENHTTTSNKLDTPIFKRVREIQHELEELDENEAIELLSDKEKERLHQRSREQIIKEQTRKEEKKQIIRQIEEYQDYIKYVQSENAEGTPLKDKIKILQERLNELSKFNANDNLSPEDKKKLEQRSPEQIRKEQDRKQYNNRLIDEIKGYEAQIEQGKSETSEGESLEEKIKNTQTQLNYSREMNAFDKLSPEEKEKIQDAQRQEQLLKEEETQREEVQMYNKHVEMMKSREERIPKDIHDFLEDFNKTILEMLARYEDSNQSNKRVLDYMDSIYGMCDKVGIYIQENPEIVGGKYSYTKAMDFIILFKKKIEVLRYNLDMEMPTYSSKLTKEQINQNMKDLQKIKPIEEQLKSIVKQYNSKLDDLNELKGGKHRRNHKSRRHKSRRKSRRRKSRRRN